MLHGTEARHLFVEWAEETVKVRIEKLRNNLHHTAPLPPKIPRLSEETSPRSSNRTWYYSEDGDESDNLDDVPQYYAQGQILVNPYAHDQPNPPGRGSTGRKKRSVKKKQKKRHIVAQEVNDELEIEISDPEHVVELPQIPQLSTVPPFLVVRIRASASNELLIQVLDTIKSSPDLRLITMKT